jgi:hypothetical protein
VLKANACLDFSRQRKGYAKAIIILTQNRVNPRMLISSFCFSLTFLEAFPLGWVAGCPPLEEITAILNPLKMIQAEVLNRRCCLEDLKLYGGFK